MPSIIHDYKAIKAAAKEISPHMLGDEWQKRKDFEEALDRARKQLPPTPPPAPPGTIRKLIDRCHYDGKGYCPLDYCQHGKRCEYNDQQTGKLKSWRTSPSDAKDSF